MKRLAFSILNIIGANALFRFLNRGKIKVLLYHNISNNISAFDFAVNEVGFERHLSHLKRHYNFVGIDQEGDWVSYRRDRPNILLTFDDGFRNNYTKAFPLLCRHRIPAVFFLISDCIADGLPPRFIVDRLGAKAEASDYRTLNRQEAAEMIAAGMTIGSHSLSHLAYDRLDDDAAIADGQDSRDRLEKLLGVPVANFAFPWGKHSRGQREAFPSIYRRVFLTKHGFCHPSDALIPRNEVANLPHLRVAASGCLDGLRALAGRVA